VLGDTGSQGLAHTALSDRPPAGAPAASPASPAPWLSILLSALAAPSVRNFPTPQEGGNTAATAATAAARGRDENTVLNTRPWHQRLTLVHDSAQPEPSVSMKPWKPPNVSRKKC